MYYSTRTLMDPGRRNSESTFPGHRPAGGASRPHGSSCQKSTSKVPRNPKSHPKVTDQGVVPVAACRADPLRAGSPGAATDHMVIGFCICRLGRPGCAVCRGFLIRLMGKVLDPLPNIAVHVIESKTIRW